MANNQAEKPRHEKDYDTLKKEYKAIQKTKDTMQLHHLDIATNAFKKHLMDDSGELDYSKLKVKDNQKNVIDEMTKGYERCSLTITSQIWQICQNKERNI
jgi:hypothetical protein